MADPVSDLDTSFPRDGMAVSDQEVTTTARPSNMLNDRSKSEEQALESHEVISLQSFSERKTWIEEKIKFLESLPPIEVFVGLDAVRASAESVPGLPTRKELEQMMEEHDAIEKETEIFDTGELTKLRQLTKAATQRNLSPEDTDVIELTLTTIYGLDKLLHLLRDRSENLEMMSIRLTWEENRINSWKERRHIIEELETFSVNGARWNTSIYEMVSQDAVSNGSRRGSITSQASVASDNVYSATFSRSARFKLAELLSRDAAQFSGKVTSLKHGKVAAAGKALDRLIDHSRKPVPDDLLDEQDKLEEKCINEMENIGKFTMHLVMQWRKADEVYVETMKDHSAASNLLEEIETAKMYHPTARQSISFTSRIDTILKRLAVRGDPASLVSSFPRPEHMLFPEQKIANDALVKKLSSDIQSTNQLARKVELVAKDYRMASDAVKRAEAMMQSVTEISTGISALLKQFKEGTWSPEGEGIPPDLTTELCLDPTTHSVFLAFLPSLLDETVIALDNASKTISNASAIIAGLYVGAIDHEFKENVTAQVNELAKLRQNLSDVRDTVVMRVARLRQARKIHSNIDAKSTFLSTITVQILDCMKQSRWRQETRVNGTPQTSEPLITSASSDQAFEAQLSDIDSKSKLEVEEPLKNLSQTLERPLRVYLEDAFSRLRNSLDTGYQLLRLLDAIKQQSFVMDSLRNEFHDILTQIEDTKLRINALVDQISQGKIDHIEAEGGKNDEDLTSMQQKVDRFISSLATRVPFISGHLTTSDRTSFHKPKTPSRSEFDTAVGIAADLVALDAAVRADSNSFAMSLNGDMEILKNGQKRFELAMMGIHFDRDLVSINNATRDLHRELEFQRTSLHEIFHENDGAVDNLHILLANIKPLRDKWSDIIRSLSPARGMLRQIEDVSNTLELSVRNTVYRPRSYAIADTEHSLGECNAELSALENEISQVIRDALRYQSELKDAAERRKQEEEYRLAAEEAEHFRLEKERKEEEERRQLLQEELAEAKRQREEEERRAYERAEQERQAREAVEAERIRLAQLEAASRKQEEALKLAEAKAQREAETLRLEQERLEVENKLRKAEALLEEERRIHAEKQQQAIEAMKRQQLEAEELTRTQQLELRQLAEEHARSKQELERVERERRKLTKPDITTVIPPTVEITDVFGTQPAPTSKAQLSQESEDLRILLAELRKRLKSININECLHPTKSSNRLPTGEHYRKLHREVFSISEDFDKLIQRSQNLKYTAELTSFKAEIKESFAVLEKLNKLVQIHESVRLCDAALSDLLEHIDSYPEPPLGILSSTHKSSVTDTPEGQLLARLAFTSNSIDEMSKRSQGSVDQRVLSENLRIEQTWLELQDMASDRLNGNKSRPSSAISRTSSRSSISHVSTKPSHPLFTHRGARKKDSYSNLSVSSIQTVPSRAKMLAPPPQQPKTRRAASSSTEQLNRSTSRLSISSTRSVSGPSINVTSSLYRSTFASRQRTTSLTSASGSTSTPSRPLLSTPRIDGETKQREKLPISQQAYQSNSLSRSSLAPSRSSVKTGSSWSRAPRESFPSMPRTVTPINKKDPLVRKKYIADPNSKLDIAVGDVINQLPVGINVEGITESWRDQSGKYWIGNQDPKLCFCRILRSQTVMVRVGGGWTELSKFIKEHFADSFLIAPLPDSPPRGGAQEEKWISSATLLEAQQSQAGTPPRAPRTPEPVMPFLPSFSLMTPSGRSPHSLRSSPSAGGSPLTPLQYIRKAEPDYISGILRPVTPSKPQGRISNPNTPSIPRTSAWRP